VTGLALAGWDQPLIGDDMAADRGLEPPLRRGEPR
jgi:hypothetical protein